MNAAGAYMAAGRPDLADRALVTAAESLLIQRKLRLLALHNLAVLAHGAGRYAEAAELGRFLVARGGGKGLVDRTRLLLADSELMLGRLGPAYLELRVLLGSSLGLSERLSLLPTACYYEACVGRWDYLTATARSRSELARLLPAPGGRHAGVPGPGVPPSGPAGPARLAVAAGDPPVGPRGADPTIPPAGGLARRQGHGPSLRRPVDDGAEAGGQ